MSESLDTRVARSIERQAAASIPITLDEVRAHPVVALPPDLDALDPARESTPGGSTMVIELERETRPDVERPAARHWPKVLAAAAAVVLAVVVGVVVSGDDASVDLSPADSGEEPGAGSAESAERIDTVLDAFGAWDMAVVGTLVVDDFNANKLLVDDYVAAGATWTRTGGCSTSGPGVLVCPVAQRDEFHGAAGLGFETDYVFAFADDGRLERVNIATDDPWDEYLGFRVAFRAWMSTEHPEVPMRYYPPAGSYSDPLAEMPLADSMPAALDHVDDFVAQSPDYGD